MLEERKSRSRGWCCPQHVMALISDIQSRLTRCVDCGCEEKALLNFDHVRGEKQFSICNALTTAVSREQLADELAKCEVRCYNCHMRRHAAEDGQRLPKYLTRAACWALEWASLEYAAREVGISMEQAQEWSRG